MLRGVNAETSETLPGFEGGRGKLSTTEKVRMRGLVERSRIAVVEVAGKGRGLSHGGSLGQQDDFTTETDDDEMDDNLQVEGNHGRWEMEIARVYEQTLVELGTALASTGA